MKCAEPAYQSIKTTSSEVKKSNNKSHNSNFNGGSSRAWRGLMTDLDGASNAAGDLHLLDVCTIEVVT